MSRCTKEEAQWRQARQELYTHLYESGKQGLNRDAVATTRKYFIPGPVFMPKPYEFEHEDDGVGLICAEIPREAALKCHAMGEELIALLPKRENDDAVGYVNELDLMHITLFHTSHPFDLAPHANTRREADIEQLKQMLSGFSSFQVKPVRVLLASSGAVILLFECLSDEPPAPGTQPSATCVNANQEFSVDHMRRVAKETFEHVPKTAGTRTIVHSTLGRILDPEVSEDAVKRVYEHCETLTKCLTEHPEPFRIRNVWYVEESHNYSPQGKKTVVTLQ
uniref:Uncharacterized protein n=1 Tax=Globisporangium ultimum (strain ATCC 200006 / CBS 805.95 / DAOM BR144) TaxID=431595 RepID=K3WW43_GLOUD